MKLFKKLIAVSMTVTMAVAMAGCNSGGDSAAGNNAESLLEKANETMSAVESATMDMVMDYGIKMGEEAMDMKMNSTINFIDKDGMKMSMTMDMAMGEQSMGETKMYAIEEGDSVTTYTNMNGAWMKASAPIGDFEQYNAGESMKLYLDNLSSFKVDGNEKVNDVDTTIISGVLSGDAMEEAMAASSLDSITQTMGMSEEEAMAMLEDLGELPVKLWIAEDGHVMKSDMDMTAMMQSLMGKVMAAAGSDEAAGRLEVTKTVITMTYSNYNAVEDFEIPAEALAAA